MISSNNSNRSLMVSPVSILPVLLIVLCLLPAAAAWAQSSQNALTSRRGTSQLGQTLRGTIQTQGLFAQRTFGSRGRATQLGLVNNSAAANPNPYATLGRSRGLGDAVRFAGTRYNNDIRNSSLLQFFGRSSTARFFSPPAFVGREVVYPSEQPKFEVGNADLMIQYTAQTKMANSFHHSVFLGLQERALRDEETNDSLINMPEISEADAQEAADNPSHAQRLQRRVTATREKLLTDAWELLSEGRFHQSQKSFKRAGFGIEEEATPMIGAFISAIADRQYSSAVFHLRALVRHDSGMFSAQFPLDTVLPSTKDGERMLSECAAIVSANPDSADYAAVQAFLLWLDSNSPTKQSSAIKAASRLRDQFRTTEYAGFLEKMEEEIQARGLDAGEIDADDPISDLG